MALGLGFRLHGNQKPSDRSSTWSGPRAPAKEKLVGDQTKVSESKRSCGNIRPEEMEQQSGYIYIYTYMIIRGLYGSITTHSTCICGVDVFGPTIWKKSFLAK